MTIKTPCHACSALCNIAEEARCRIASGEDPTRLAHVVWFGTEPGYLSSSIPQEAHALGGYTERYQSLADWAGTTH